MLRLFKCWNVDDGGEEAGMDFLVESASKAAEWFAKMRDRESGDGYSEEQTVIVKDMEAPGEPMRFDVRAGDEVVYRAKRFEQDKNQPGLKSWASAARSMKEGLLGEEHGAPQEHQEPNHREASGLLRLREA